ncbi:MAG TPA: hypothetical protein VFB80_17905 [Pirellulaceae bacterium]|nr:hypothetical protein [Pirellulaceae bacterium]
MKVIAVLCGLLFASSSAAIILAAIHIESIVITGPTAGFLGFLLALVAAFRRRRLLTAANLSLPLLGVTVFLLIFCNRWSPRDAQHPVTAILLGYEVLAAPLWLGGLWSIVHGSPAGPRKWQFPIRTLMIVTLVVALALGAARIAMRQSAEVLVAVAAGLLILVLCALVALAVQALNAQSPPLKSPSPA